jgi:hypothetical protein
MGVFVFYTAAGFVIFGIAAGIADFLDLFIWG